MEFRERESRDFRELKGRRYFDARLVNDIQVLHDAFTIISNLTIYLILIGQNTGNYPRVYVMNSTYH